MLACKFTGKVGPARICSSSGYAQAGGLSVATPFRAARVDEVMRNHNVRPSLAQGRRNRVGQAGLGENNGESLAMTIRIEGYPGKRLRIEPITFPGCSAFRGEAELHQRNSPSSQFQLSNTIATVSVRIKCTPGLESDIDPS
jgi:hypothetical protein